MNPFPLLYHYWRAKRLHFDSRTALEAYQQRQLQRLRRRILSRSPYFAPYLDRPLHEWPLTDKAVMMAHFDRINTAGLTLDAVLACARQAEASRDFSPTLNGYSVGLSSGTTGQRGVFLVSPAEQARWAGTVLAKLLPQGLLHRERIAFFLRANNNLYDAVRTPTVCFEFFDLFDDFQQLLKRLQAYRPTVVVAPAGVLAALAAQTDEQQLSPKQVVSVAEVLDEQTERLLLQRFGTVRQVYQATEGFLACSCTHGRLHLNEEYVHIEPQWLDGQRFVPVITDFSRSSQPVVRYRLDDVLLADEHPCSCGSATRIIRKIEGRQGDTLQLPQRGGGRVPLFADVCERVFAQQLPLLCDYQLDQTGDCTLSLTLPPEHSGLLTACVHAFNRAFDAAGADTQALVWQTHGQAIIRHPADKRRRIRNRCIPPH